MKLIFNVYMSLGTLSQLPQKLQERYLEYLSRHEDWAIRDRVASHTNTPSHILEKLANDSNWWVRRSVSERNIFE
jgi:hypothetical protein